MKLVINKDRSVIPVGTWGTKNENDFEIVDFEFPEELEGYNKRIVYLLGGGNNPWDVIMNNKAYITNEITSKENVKGYVLCTKENPDRPADTDFRSREFDMPFYPNENPTGVVPTPVQVDGFNTMLTEMNNKIDEVDALEQTIGAAEAQRQEAEATRVSNENTRQSNESTRESNEQTRQSQEAERERRTDEAIENIEDKTAEYNANAEVKTTAFNNNATQKTNDFNTNATTQKTDFNSNASSKTSAFNSNAETKTNAFNTNATNKTNDFNSNATERTTTFDDNASTKTSEFNTNAESKASDFNDNATSKTTGFNDNAIEKTTAFNTNAQNKIDEYDEHIADYQAQIDELQEEVEELSENMPWNTTEQATEISVTDAAKYSRNKLELFGNTEQDNTKMTYKCDGTEIGDYYLTYDSTNYYFTMPTITEGDILVFDTADLKLYLADTEITTESTGTGTNLTFIASPNPDYPQDIHVVTGNNTISIQGKNLIDYSALNKYNRDLSGAPSVGSPLRYYNNSKALQFNVSVSNFVGKNIFFSFDFSHTNFRRFALDTNGNYIETFSNGGLIKENYSYITILINSNVDIPTSTNIKFMAEQGSIATSYVPYYHADYPINLGNIKLCKIDTNQYNIFKNTQDSEYYRSTLIENGWYYIPIFFQEINNADSFNRNTCEGDSSKFHYSMRLNSDIQSVNFNYKQTGLINYGKVNQHARQTVRGLYQGFNLGAKVLYLYTDEDSALTLEQFKAKWNEKLQNIPIQVYALKEDRTPVQITDETLIAQLDAIYEHLQLVKGTNNITVTAEDIAPNMKLTYMQDLPSKLDNLDSRLALLE